MVTDSEVNIDRLYEEAVRYLDDNYAYFLTNVLNIGSPSWTHAIDTAAVVLPEGAKKGEFEFIFNPSFAAQLTAEQFAFVLAHETMHIVLYHLSLCRNTTFTDHRVFNIAADCVINDYLDGAGLDVIGGICRGDDVVGFNCANSTVTEVYNIIEGSPDIMQKLGLEGTCEQCGGDLGGGQSGSGGKNGDQDGKGSGGDEKGENGDQDGEGGSGGNQDGEGEGHQHGNTGKPCSCNGGKFVVIDDHQWMHDPDAFKKFTDAVKQAGISPDDLPDDLEEILNETINEYKKTQVAGKGTAAKDEFLKEQKVTMKWVELLEKVDPDMFYEPGAGPKPLSTFRTPRRKLVHMHPRIILPSAETPDKGPLTSKSDRKPAIVLALDTSGSIGRETANKFVNLGKSIPQDKVKVFACTFQDGYMPLDLDNPRWRSGGTNFSPIEQFIQRDVLPENDGKYPKAVVVVTDGYASFYNNVKPTKEHAANWFWLLLDDYQKNSAIQQLAGAAFGFDKANFDTLNGYVDGSVNWR